MAPQRHGMSDLPDQSSELSRSRKILAAAEPDPVGAVFRAGGDRLVIDRSPAATDAEALNDPVLSALMRRFAEDIRPGAEPMDHHDPEIGRSLRNGPNGKLEPGKRAMAYAAPGVMAPKGFLHQALHVLPPVNGPLHEGALVEKTPVSKVTKAFLS